MASLLYLKHTFALADEDVVERWIEKPNWQHFSGERSPGWLVLPAVATGW